MSVAAPVLRAARGAAVLLSAIASCWTPGTAVPAPPPSAAPLARPTPPAVETVLPSGLRVVVVEHHRRPLLEAALVFPSGTLADPRGGSGATRLAMQLASDYYEQAPDGSSIPGERSFRRQIVELGGDVAFQATADASVIWFSGLATDYPAYFELLAGALENPRRGAESFLTRRNKLLDALDDLETADPEAMRQALQEAAFGVGSPYARPERGNAADLSRLGLETVEAQQDRILVPGGATLVVVGDVRAAQVVAKARVAFRRWNRAQVPPPRWTQGPLASVPGVAYLRRQPAATLLVCAARPLAGVKATNAQLEVLAAMLGEGYRSRLMLSLREDGGLAYTASAELILRRHARALLACAAVAGDQADQGVRRMRQVLTDLRGELPTEPELARARASAIARRQASTEHAAGILGAWVDALVLGQVAPDLDRERATLERVTAAEVQRVARETFSNGTILWILSGDRIAAAQAAASNGLGTLRPLRAH